MRFPLCIVYDSVQIFLSPRAFHRLCSEIMKIVVVVHGQLVRAADVARCAEDCNPSQKCSFLNSLSFLGLLGVPNSHPDKLGFSFASICCFLKL